MGERGLCKPEVVGSIPSSSTNIMKIRTSFVSNSSSTSFVIGINRSTNPQLFNLLQSWCEHNCYYDTEVFAKGKQEILDLFAKDHPYDYADVEDIKEYSDDTWDFIYMSLSYHDDVINHYIHTDGVKFFYSNT